MSEANRNDKWVWFVTLAVFAVGIFGLGIYASLRLKPTELDVTLLSALELIFSVGASWIIADISAHSGFHARQRQFAIAAYRRIKEIDSGIERLLQFVGQRKGDGQADSVLDTVQAVGEGVKFTIQSAIADWGDIIGPEIRTFEHATMMTDEPAADKVSLKMRQSQIEEALKALPFSLQLSAKTGTNRWDRLNDASADLAKRVETTGYIEMDGLWTSECPGQIANLHVGDRVHIWISDVGSRVGAFVVHDSEGLAIGTLTNLFFGRLHFHEFSAALTKYLGRSAFDGALSYIQEQPEGSDQATRYFKVKIVP